MTFFGIDFCCAQVMYFPTLPSFFGCNAFSDRLPLNDIQFISCVSQFIVLSFQKDFSLNTSHTIMYLTVTLGLCMYKEFVLYPNNGVYVEGTVWLSKRNKTAKSLLNHTCLVLK